MVLMGYPEGLQVEPTNECNLSCVMCVRRTWRGGAFGFMDLGLYRRLVDEGSGKLRRLALYGFGEPLLHPGFPEMVRYAREVLGDSAYILTVTNGTLMSPARAAEVFGAGIDEVAFSVDAPELDLLSRIRVGVQSYDVLGNLRSAARLKEDYGVRLGVSLVLMKSNYRRLPRVAEAAGELGLDFLVVSHVVPYSPGMVGEAVYTTASRFSVEFYEKSGQDLSVLAREAMQDEFLLHYTYASRGKRKLYLQLVDRLASSGYSVNAEIVRDALSKKSLFEEVQLYLKEAARIAEEYGVEVKLPSLYADAKRRSCPYIDSNYAVVLWNGDVVPCMDLAYTHPLYTNMHYKLVRRVVFGNASREPLGEIWESPRYRAFREARRKLSDNVPWCGDCPFATSNCWYVSANEFDCYGNEVGCNECLYSAGLAHCLV